MAKVFTITEGLENMGALKTGGQGSVYKARRTGEIITAVKLLPTPIFHESEEDKNYRDFKNEVQKLKKVNEKPNPHVVKILSSGITESGSFPFIEMEFIEGPDLEELLKPPHPPLFTVKETIKVAEQLASALAHCHQVEVKHGDIKSNNVKLNIHTGNYVLLDFGLAVMSDEQRRTSLRHAGAIEFMAPEQNEGQMLYQTDVYSYGIVLYELLAGTVPFPLRDKGETSRNSVMIAHMESPVPDLMQERRSRIPQEWSAQKRDRELQVPQWLVHMIQKCLEKKPEARFKNGVELYDYLHHNSTGGYQAGEDVSAGYAAVQAENSRLRKLILQYQQENEQLKEEQTASAQQLTQQQTEIDTWRAHAPKRSGVSQGAFIALLLLTLGLGALAAYALLNNKKLRALTSEVTGIQMDESPNRTVQEPVQEEKPQVARRQPRAVMPEPEEEPNSNADNEPTNTPQNERRSNNLPTQDSSASEENEDNNAGADDGTVKYKVIAEKAFFHNEPDPYTRRNAFIVKWNNAVLTPLEEKDGFVYVIYTNPWGQTSKGWLNKEDLRPVR